MTFERVVNAPSHVIASLGSKKVRFNQKLPIDIVHIDGRDVLHIVDQANYLSSKQFQTKRNTDSVWNAFVSCWCAVYSGSPNKRITDQGSQFREKFIDIAQVHDIIVLTTGVEARNSLDIGEGYHQLFRNIYRKLRLDNKKLAINLVLKIVCKAMNDTLGPEIMVPTALLFGELLSLRPFSEPRELRQSPHQRAKIVNTVRKIAAAELANAKIRQGARAQVTESSNSSSALWTESSGMTRKDNKQHKKIRAETYATKTMDPERKNTIVDLDGEHKRFSVMQVKPFL